MSFPEAGSGSIAGAGDPLAGSVVGGGCVSNPRTGDFTVNSDIRQV